MLLCIQGLLEELKDQTDLGKRGEGWTIAQFVAVPFILLPPFHLEVSSLLGLSESDCWLPHHALLSLVGCKGQCVAEYTKIFVWMLPRDCRCRTLLRTVLQGPWEVSPMNCLISSGRDAALLSHVHLALTNRNSLQQSIQRQILSCVPAAVPQQRLLTVLGVFMVLGGLAAM